MSMRPLLVSSKDMIEPSCEGKYGVETKILLRTRVKEHRDEVEKASENMHFTRGNRRASEQDRRKLAIMDHAVQKNHVMTWDHARMVKKESDWTVTGIRESIWIRKYPQCFNRDDRRNHLAHIYNDFLPSP